MRSTILVASALAMGAFAKPLLEKRYIVTHVDLTLVTKTVYVTPGAPAPTAESNGYGYHHGGYNHKKSSTSVAPPPPSSSAAPVYTPPVSSAPAYTPPSSAVQSSEAPASSAPATGDHKSGEIQATFESGPDYQAAVVYHHNAARANHGAPPLVWDDEVAANAQKCAETCTFEHMIVEGSGNGQNIFTSSSDSFNVTAAITESWYKGEFEAMLPYFGQNSIPDDVFHSVGHLTAMVWKGTTKVGCYSMDCGSRMTVGSDTSSPMNKFTVCNYYSAGNIVNNYAANVGSPISTTNLGSWLD